MSPDVAKPRETSFSPRMRWVASLVILAIIALAATIWSFERAGWPFLAGPAERWLSNRLQRDVTLTHDQAGGFKLKLWGAIDLEVGKLEVAKAGWSNRGPMLIASRLHARLSYRDLFKSRDGGALRLESLAVDDIQLDLERRSATQANWMLRDPASNFDLKPFFESVAFGSLEVGHGSLSLNDAVIALNLSAEFKFAQHELASLKKNDMNGLVASGKGRFRDFPVTFRLSAGSTQELWTSSTSSPSLPITLSLRVGEMKLEFKGQLVDPLGRREVLGAYTLGGPSLALVGLPFGVTLPTTRAFTMQGRVAVTEKLWSTVVDKASIGRSRLSGEFQFDRSAGQLPTLLGRLRGSVLWLEDLGPAIGMPLELAGDQRRGARVLPQRKFNFPALSLMNANVLVELDRLESGSALLQAVSPLHARILLHDAVLELAQIDGHLAQGRIRGNIRLDGKKSKSNWQIHLLASKIEIEQWVHQVRKSKTSPAFLTGRMAARIDLKGEGRSVAEMLGSSDGQIAIQLTRGTISHLAVELAGIDIAQALGVWIKGDDSLAITCGVADLEVKAGVARPRVMLVDTKDSTLWLEGAASLADESIDLTLKVNPKDFSPLALRAPLQVKGSFSAPALSINKTPLIGKILSAIALAAINPLAAVLPLIDVGDDSAKAPIAACRAAAFRGQKLKSKD